MTHIEQIKDAIRQKQQEVWPTDTGEMKPATVPNNLEQGWLNALSWMEKFINSLPAEQPSERLGDEIDHFRCSDIFALAKRAGEEVTATAQHFADWQKEQMMKSAIDAVIVNDEMSGCVVDCEQGCLVLEPHTYPIGQQLKILIIKEDE